MEVCDTRWNYSHLVCQELDCSNAIEGSFGGKQPAPDREYHHVTCEDYHDKLGQCDTFKAKCDKRLVSVYCVCKCVFCSTNDTECADAPSVRHSRQNNKLILYVSANHGYI